MKNVREEVKAAKEELEVAVSNFNHAIELDVIDYWIYRIKSAQTKYDHLIREVREETA